MASCRKFPGWLLVTVACVAPAATSWAQGDPAAQLRAQQQGADQAQALANQQAMAANAAQAFPGGITTPQGALGALQRQQQQFADPFGLGGFGVGLGLGGAYGFDGLGANGFGGYNYGADGTYNYNPNGPPRRRSYGSFLQQQLLEQQRLEAQQQFDKQQRGKSPQVTAEQAEALKGQDQRGKALARKQEQAAKPRVKAKAKSKAKAKAPSRTAKPSRKAVAPTPPLPFPPEAGLDDEGF